MNQEDLCYVNINVNRLTDESPLRRVPVCRDGQGRRREIMKRKKITGYYSADLLPQTGESHAETHLLGI